MSRLSTAMSGASRDLSEHDFAEMFGEKGDLPAECLALIRRHDFRHRPLDEAERTSMLAEILERIRSGAFPPAGSERRSRWEAGWRENLDALRAGGGPDALRPRYIRPRQPVRLRGAYVLPQADDFEMHWFDVFSEWLFRTHFRITPTIYEFGCGSGINLARLASMFSYKRYVGLDWAPASKEILDELARRHGWNMEGRVFDFFNPDPDMEIEDGSMVFTLGALEQTGTGWGPFLEHVLRFRPHLCIHVEPVVEWYGRGTPEDEAAALYHRERRYWEGFPARLRALEADGRIQIVKMLRSGFGSMYVEGYSQIMWRPL